jgi:ABC-2 type transport system ATP-binding protein
MLEIKNLVKTFGTRKALQGIGFHLKKGEIYGLLGPNGAGKTTTLKILSGLLLFDSGEIRIKGELYHRDNAELKRAIAYVPDEPFVYEKLTGEEHLHFYADLYKVPDSVRQEKFDFFFKHFEFESYRHEPVETYSAGTRQKLLLSQAFLVEPEILLLDEPLSSIDPLVARKFRNHLKEIAKKGTVVLLATHILSLAQDVSSRIGIIINGNIAAEGDLSELLKMSAGQNLEDFYFNTVMAYEESD